MDKGTTLHHFDIVDNQHVPRIWSHRHNVFRRGAEEKEGPFENSDERQN